MGNQVHKSFSDVSETKPKKELRADMENQNQTSFTLEIDNFSVKEAAVSSPIFLGSGCEWYVIVYPNGNGIEDHLSVYLYVANPKSLRPGWKRRANYSFIVLNQSGQELSRTYESSDLFSGQVTGRRGFHNYYHQMFPFSKLKEEGNLENTKLIIEVELEVIEGELSGIMKMLDIQGFNVLYSQASYLNMIFSKHPDIVVNLREKDNGVKTEYMNLLLSLIEKLHKSPQSFSEHSKLTEQAKAGFKLDWLKTNFEEVSLERKNAIANGSWIKVEERIKNLEMSFSDLKVETESENAKFPSATKVLSFYDILSCQIKLLEHLQ